MSHNHHGQPLPIHLAYRAHLDENLTQPAEALAPGQLPTAVGQFPLTPPDILGPYFKSGSSHRADLMGGGEDITLTGIVQDKKGFPLPKCKLDFWMANPEGIYSGFADQGTEGMDFGRGHVFTNAEGEYEVRFRRPGHYDIGGGEERTAHIHVQYKPTNGPVQTTQLYFPDDPFNSKDAHGIYNKNADMLDMKKVSDTEFTFTFTAKTFH